jgi:hypothetical protein
MTKNYHNTITFLLVICIFFCACPGCRKNTLSSKDISFHAHGLFDDRYCIEFTTTKPLDSPPVAFYSIEKNGEGINDVVISIFRKTPKSLPPNTQPHQVCTTKDDKSGYVISIPLKAPEDYPVRFHHGDKTNILTKVSCTPAEISEETTSE